MERLKSLSPGQKLVLFASPLLFVSLFLTWQKLEVSFGQAGHAVALLDGWDGWGLLIGLLALALTVFAVVAYLTDVELSEDVPWERLLLGGGVAVLVLTVVKNLLDADSAWASYVGRRPRCARRTRSVRDVGGGVRAPVAPRPGSPPARRQLNRLTSSARSSPGPS